jgi:FLVCR family feline leukemia virus subgroup C receptor-related protein
MFALEQPSKRPLATSISIVLMYSRLVLRICNGLTTVFFFFLITSLLSENKLFFFMSYFCVCGCSAIMALSFELACELSFPASENTTIAIFGLLGNLINFSQSIPEILILKVKC